MDYTVCVLLICKGLIYMKKCKVKNKWLVVIICEVYLVLQFVFDRSSSSPTGFRAARAALNPVRRILLLPTLPEGARTNVLYSAVVCQFCFQFEGPTGQLCSMTDLALKDGRMKGMTRVMSGKCHSKVVSYRLVIFLSVIIHWMLSMILSIRHSWPTK